MDRNRGQTGANSSAAAQPTRSASIQSSSERAPLLSPSQRHNQRAWSHSSSRQDDEDGDGILQRMFGRHNEGRIRLTDHDHEGGDCGAYLRRASTPKNLVRALFALFVIMIAAVVIAAAAKESSDRKKPGFGTYRPYLPRLAKGSYGAVAAEEERCSKIGVDVLKEGGNAVDAAIASTFCTGVVSMYSSGIGGGGFMIVRDPRECTKAEARRGLKKCSTKAVIDFRETAPAKAFPEMYVDRPMEARWGGLASGVPGELRGLEEAHRRYGKLDWARLVAPAIKLAKGTYVSRELDARLKRFSFFFIGDPDWDSTFVNPDTGMLVKSGDRISRPALAKVLQDVSDHGAKAFYEGEHAESMVAKLRSRGGIMTLEDFASYKAVTREAVAGKWRDRTVYTSPAPTSGPVLLSMLQVLSMYKDWIKDGIRDGRNMHRLIESMKFASAQRTRIGDPDYMNKQAQKNISEISTMREAARIHSRINDSRTYDIDYYQPLYDVKDQHGTMHLSTADKNGMACALTSTVNLPFGSAVMDPNTGVILNDEMDDSSTPGVPNAFGLWPSPFNYPEPGKRPLSSTSPAIVEDTDGSLLVTIGGSGGSRIFGSVAQVLLNLDWGLDISQAIERPRLHHQLLPTYVSAENTVEPGIIESLESRGHDVQLFDINSAVAEVQAVVVKGSGRHRDVLAASDSRKGGIAVAY